MDLLIAALAVLVLGVAAVAATGSLGAMPEVDDDTFVPSLPDGRLSADDIRAVRFGVQPRGYDMAQVDAALARLADQLEGDATAQPTPDAPEVWNNDDVQDDEKRGSHGSDEAAYR